VSTFKALLVNQEDGKFSASIQQISRDALPAGEVLVRVAYSSLNYKDGLAVTGKPGVIRMFPMVPGVDFAGVVEESSAAEFKLGDEVIVTGCGTAETMWGGYAQLARLDHQFMVPLPQGMTLVQAMGIGTAGFTAMQSVMELERHGLQPGGREVLVTGAAGGVGSVAIAILAKLGYKAVGSSGRPDLHDYLKGLGASEILDRAARGRLPRNVHSIASGGQRRSTASAAIRWRASCDRSRPAAASLRAAWRAARRLTLRYSHSSCAV
jgi:acrylyl-CoA reductase (NADPH)